MTHLHEPNCKFEQKAFNLISKAKCLELGGSGRNGDDQRDLAVPRH